MSKYFSLAAVGLAASLGAYAAVPTDAAPFQVVVPCLHDGFEFVLEGLYLQPTASNLDYATITTSANVGSFTGTDTQVKSINPGYNFGFRLGAGYIFKDSGNDVQLDWAHFSHNTSNSIGGIDFLTGSTVVVNDNELVPNEFADVSATADMKYDAVRLNVGQFLDIGTRLRTRMFAGLEVARVQDNLTDNEAFAVLPLPTSGETAFAAASTQDSKFTGIGPQFGVDSSYNITDCFGIVGHFNAALLVGQVKTSSSLETVTSTIANSVVTNTFSDTDLSVDNVTRVVPALEGKLGLDYTWPINNDKSELSIEAGYQATELVDSVDRLSGTSRNTSGFGLSGPYLNLNFRM